MVTLRKKLHRASWLLRYWVLDKYHPQLRVVALGIALLLGAFVAYDLLAVHTPAPIVAVDHIGRPAVHQQKAFVWWVQLIIMIVAAIVSYALAPKPKPPKPVKAEQPKVQDGQSKRRIYGTVWTNDSAILAWKNGKPEPIRKKGGKK